MTSEWHCRWKGSAPGFPELGEPRTHRSAPTAGAATERAPPAPSGGARGALSATTHRGAPDDGDEVRNSGPQCSHPEVEGVRVQRCRGAAGSGGAQQEHRDGRRRPPGGGVRERRLMKQCLPLPVRQDESTF